MYQDVLRGRKMSVSCTNTFEDASGSLGEPTVHSGKKKMPVRTYVIAHGLKSASELCYTMGELR